MDLSPHLEKTLKTLKVQHLRSVLLTSLTNLSSILLFLRRVQMGVSCNPILQTNLLEIFNQADPNCLEDDDVARRIKQLYMRNRLSEPCHMCSFHIKNRVYVTTCNVCNNYRKFKWISDKSYLNNSIRYVANISTQPDCESFGLA